MSEEAPNLHAAAVSPISWKEVAEKQKQMLDLLGNIMDARFEVEKTRFWVGCAAAFVVGSVGTLCAVALAWSHLGG